MNNVMILKVSC